MNIQPINTPYEILFRLAPDGTVQGCHKRELQQLIDLDTGTVHNTRELDPQPVVGAEVEAVLGVIAAAQADTIIQRDDEIAELQNQLTEKDAQLNDCSAEIIRLANELAAATAVNGEVNAGAE